MSAGGLSVRLHHAFPATRIAVAFEAPARGVSVLFGPSGSGKSTVIAAVAGLLRPHAGRIALGERVLSDTAAGLWVAPERRRIGMVFQDSRLFPHMSVATNLRFGQRRAPAGDAKAGDATDAGFDEVVALLDIAPLLARRPAALSGGERQRVAIGRALLARPRLLLMDEPLASLDADRKAEILPYLGRLRQRGIPILYVTHAVEELLGLADFVVLLNAGGVVAAGPVAELATRPDLPLARRDDAGAVLACRVAAHEPARGLTRLSWGAAAIWVAALDRPPGTELRLRLPAREIILARPEMVGFGAMLSLHNLLPGTVGAVAIDAAGRTALVRVDTPDGTLLSRVLG
jgi:molybdate transport system ATP-binding protein